MSAMNRKSGFTNCRADEAEGRYPPHGMPQHSAEGAALFRPTGKLASPTGQSGFSLVEAVVVIAITGILSSVVAVFIQGPVQGYMDASRRAQLTDIADTAVRRMGRDLRLALPNSVRVTQVGAAYYLEFLQTSGGGRYRAEAPGDILDFTSTADNSFDVLGPAVNVAAGDQIVVYNLGIPGADAYQGVNRRAAVGSGALTNIGYAPTAVPFPLASPGKRFQMVSGPVSFVCDPVAGTLRRYWNYAIQPAQPTAFGGAASGLLADNVSGCAFTYDATVVAQRAGLVSMFLQISSSGENVNLYHATHVSNAP